MFEKIVYDLRSINYFNPKDTENITRQDLVKILSWKTYDENKFTSTDYSYFILSSVFQTFNRFTPDLIDTIFMKSRWFWLFKIKQNSSIIIPWVARILFSAWYKDFMINSFPVSPWIWWWAYQIDKNSWLKIINTDIDLDQLLTILTKVYWTKIDLNNI